MYHVQNEKSPGASNTKAFKINSSASKTNTEETNAKTDKVQQKSKQFQRLTSGEWDNARKLKNTAVLITIKNGLKPAPTPYCKPLLSFERLHELFTVNFETGELFCKKPRGGLRVGDKCGTLMDGYIQVFADGEAYRAHRIIWKMFHGTDPKGQIDHKNGNRADNRIENLADVLPVENSRNRNCEVASNSGHRGVSWCTTRKRWTACIGANDRTVHLGGFFKKEHAVEARAHAESVLFQPLVGGTS